MASVTRYVPGCCCGAATLPPVSGCGGCPGGLSLNATATLTINNSAITGGTQVLTLTYSAADGGWTGCREYGPSSANYLRFNASCVLDSLITQSSLNLHCSDPMDWAHYSPSSSPHFREILYYRAISCDPPILKWCHSFLCPAGEETYTITR